MSERSLRLKRNTVVKALGSAKEGKAYRKGVRICLERAKLITESYRETEGMPMVLKRAKALGKILDNMTIYIQDEEIIVGNFASSPESLPTYPELYTRWLEKAVRKLPDYKAMLSDDEKKELTEINSYWEDKCLHGMERKYLPDDINWKPYQMGGGVWLWNWEIGTPDYEKLFRVGLKGLVKEAKEKIGQIKNDRSLDSDELIAAKDFLDAAVISLNAAIRWGKRYGRLAAEMAENEKDKNRKKELERIAEVCGNVPENPPRNYQEALQFYWFIHLIVNFIEHPQIGSGVRFDKVVGPYYGRDAGEGKLNREYAQELMEMLFVKFQETGFLQPPIWLPGGGGGLGWQTITVGGIDHDGRDITNEVTFIVLDAMKEIQTIAPPLALRYHGDTPKEVVHKAIEVTRAGVAQPAFFSDKVNIKRLASLGVSETDAKDYSINNCMYPTLPGKNVVHRGITGGTIVLPLCLNLALHEGTLFGSQVGAKTPPAESFESYEDVMEAFVEQYRHTCANLVHICNIADSLCKKYMPRPFLSAVLDGCIEKAKDLREWTYWPYNHFGAYGANNASDALAAIRKLVFEEKKLTLKDLTEAIGKNYQDAEDVRLAILNDAPKFGNDDDYVDDISRDVQYRIKTETEQFKDIYGGSYTLDGTAATGPIGIGLRSPATPDGRLALEPFHDGTISPVQGRDTKGPTATMKSVSKIDPLLSTNHLLNQKFLPQYMEGDNVEIFAAYLKTWYDLGVHHIQFNAVDRDTLLDAQQHPEKHSDLIVRVCGYSSYFIDLHEGMQNEIIKRTEQCL